MKKQIIHGRPLSPQEFAWGIVALVALTAAFGMLFRYPILAIVAFGVLIAALGRGGFLRNIRNVWRESYWLKHINKLVIRSSNAQMSKHR